MRVTSTGRLRRPRAAWSPAKPPPTMTTWGRGAGVGSAGWLAGLGKGATSLLGEMLGGGVWWQEVRDWGSMSVLQQQIPVGNDRKKSKNNSTRDALWVLLEGDVQGAGVAGGGEGDDVGGDAGKGGGGEGDGSVEGGGGGGGLSAEELGLGAAAVGRAWRRPGVDGLEERDGASGHGVAVHVADAEDDLGGSIGDGDALGGSGDGLNPGVFGARSEGAEVDALLGSVEAGGGAGLLAWSERSDGEGLGGDARGTGDDGGGDGLLQAGPTLPCDGLAGGGRTVFEGEGLGGPHGGGSGGDGEGGVEGGEHGGGASGEVGLEAGAVGEAGGDDGEGGVDGCDVHGGGAVAGGDDGAGGFAAGEGGGSAGDGVGDGDPAGGGEVATEGGDGEGNLGADGDGVRGRGDEGEGVAVAGVVTDAAGEDGLRVVDGEVVDFDVDGTGDASGGGRCDGSDFIR